MRLVVTLADGRAVPVALNRGIALSPLVDGTRPGDRPVCVSAIDRNGATIERRAARLDGSRLARALAAAGDAEAAHEEPAREAAPPRTLRRRPRSQPAPSSSEIWSNRPSALLSDFIPNPADPGEQLYVKAATGG